VQEGNSPEGHCEGYDMDASFRDPQRLQDGLDDMGEGRLPYPPVFLASRGFTLQERTSPPMQTR
jgi:hypothetical protein